MQARKQNIVCFGGGTGLPSLLAGLKHNPLLDITAVVSMFDTGGSSGDLKDRFGILPPGDVLKCLLALSEDEAVARKILLTRIDYGEFPGHTGGNLLLLALEKVYGNYRVAIDALGKMLGTRGRVVPVTTKHSTLCARYTDKSIRKGETNVDIGIYEGRSVRDLFLEPDVEASKDALEALHAADAFCVGPGSFYTSVLPNFLPLRIKETIAHSRAPIIYIANLVTEGFGMVGTTVLKNIATLERYLGRPVDAAIVNKSLPSSETIDRYAEEKKEPILAPHAPRVGATVVVEADLWLDPSIARHDSSRLASVVSMVINKLNKLNGRR